ncbi:MAG: hypothetical protein PHV74_10570 [Dehalococcoidia bacterium]|nr:hypothetical protein [Dehalococcoidia bacterium]
MEEKSTDKPMVWVKDRAGNEFLCQIDALKDPKEFPEIDLENCIDDAKMIWW